MVAFADTVAKTERFVLIVAGLPGAGKTALADRLAPLFGARIVSRDVVRAAMFVPCAFTDTEKQASFQAVLAAVDANCRLAASTIVEGMPFSRVGEIEAVCEASECHGIPCFTVVCDVPVAVAQARVRAQQAAGVPMADDRAAKLVEEVAERFRQPPPDALVIDATRSLDDLAAQVVAHVRAHVAPTSA
ncbi:MAG: ATP-binding protein [Actinomycetota bacterium]|nr:ATP-binding protein [Actinomycetota bacterium]